MNELNLNGTLVWIFWDIIDIVFRHQDEVLGKHIFHLIL